MAQDMDVSSTASRLRSAKTNRAENANCRSVYESVKQQNLHGHFRRSFRLADTPTDVG